MKHLVNTRELVRAAKLLAHEEFCTPTIEAVLAVFYRLCIEYDREVEANWGPDGDEQRGPPH